MTPQQIDAREKVLTAIVTMTPMVAMVLFVKLLFTSSIRPFECFSFILFYLIGEIGAEVGHHRYFSHRAFQAQRSLKIFLAIAASISGKGSIFEFAAVHRRHHNHSDTDNDPHSPWTESTSFIQRALGFMHGYYLWIFRIKMTPAEHARVLDLLKDPDLNKYANRKMYYLWLVLGLLLPGAVASLWYGDWESGLRGILISGLVRLFFEQHTAFLINTVCHTWGNRPFNTRDRSTNNPLLALLTLGVGWHNNHHAFPSTAFNSFLWWQIDPCGWFIKICERLGLASNCQFPSPDRIREKLRLPAQ
jgi:stearoyl-CoA desaturase (delta-9 desaturase)